MTIGFPSTSVSLVWDLNDADDRPCTSFRIGRLREQETVRRRISEVIIAYISYFPVSLKRGDIKQTASTMLGCS